MNSNQIIQLFYREYLSQNGWKTIGFTRGEIACLKKNGIKILVKGSKITINIILP